MSDFIIEVAEKLFSDGLISSFEKALEIVTEHGNIRSWKKYIEREEKQEWMK